MGNFMKKVAADRFGGERPAAPRALGASLVAGAAATVLTYRLLRR